MQLPYPPRLLAILPLALTLEACPHPSTPSSNARTDRPTLPTLNPEFVKAFHLKPLGHPETGVIVQVDQGYLQAMAALLAEAIGDVTKANTHAAGVKQERRCLKAIWANGIAPADCPKG